MQTLRRSVAHSPALPKCLLFWLAYFASLFAALLVAQFLPHRWFWYGWGTFGCLGAWCVILWFVHAEGSDLAQVGLRFGRFTFPHFLGGLAAGVLLIGIIFSLLLHFGHLHREPAHDASVKSAVFWSAALIPNALHEELGFRSYTLLRLQNRFGVLIAQLMIAVFFALYHFIGGMDLVTAVISTGVWSVLYGMATVLSRGIGLATGVHAGANIGQAILGIKAGFPAVWSVVPDRAPAGAHLQAMALGIQAGVLLSAIAIMATFYLKRKRSLPGARGLTCDRV